MKNDSSIKITDTEYTFYVDVEGRFRCKELITIELKDENGVDINLQGHFLDSIEMAYNGRTYNINNPIMKKSFKKIHKRIKKQNI